MDGEPIVGWRSDQGYACSTCAPGRFRDEVARTMECTQCPVGMYATAGQSSCSVCDPGRVTSIDSPGATSCMTCSPGTGPNADSTACEQCMGPTYSITGQCQECPDPNVVSEDHRTCTACAPGKQPNDERTMCIDCTRSTYSQFGIQCQQCDDVVSSDRTTCARCPPGEGPVTIAAADGTNTTTCQLCAGNSASERGQCTQCKAGSAANSGKTRCEDAALVELSHSDVLVDVIQETNMLPVATLQAVVTDIDIVLVVGSGPEATFVQSMKQELALSLDVELSSLEISGLRQAAASDSREDGGGMGRRMQSAAGTVEFDVKITGPNMIAALSLLNEQLANPSSSLRSRAGISSDDPAWSLICPVGTYRPIGDGQCSFCSDTSVPDSDNGFRSCKDCIAGQAPDATHSRCVCANNFYNSSAGTRQIKCFTGSESWAALPLTSNSDCLACAATGCTDGAITCVGGSVTLNADFAVSSTLATQGVPLEEMTGQRNIYACEIPGACLGETEVGAACSSPYTGPLCDYCASGYSRPGFTGECTECTEGLSAAWAVLGAICAVAGGTFVLYWVSSVQGTQAGRMTVIVTIGKIAISLAQVLTQLEFSLNVRWPVTFRWLIDLLKVLSMDLLGFLNIGCVTQYTYMRKFAFANLLAPTMLLGVAIVYQLRKDVDGIVNRCIKMVFLVLFLVYPFVSQTVFQGFSCTQLDEEEEWLEVDYQISCLSDSYLAFVTIGMVGVFVYPVGIPTITMLQLWRFAGDIKTGGAARSRYEFLVADYKPE